MDFILILLLKESKKNIYIKVEEFYTWQQDKISLVKYLAKIQLQDVFGSVLQQLMI